MMVRRAFLVLLVICLGCSAQSPPSAQAPVSSQASAGNILQLVEHQVRSEYLLPPHATVSVSGLHASEFPNYDAVTVTFDYHGRKRIEDFLLSRDHKTLLKVARMDLTKDPYLEIMKKIDVTGRPTRGNKDAKVVVVNYDDFECPFCSRMHTTLFPEIFREYSDRVLFIYKDYPLEEIHPWAIHAAVDANCLAAQSPTAFWDYADYLHTNQQALAAARGHETAELDRLAFAQGQRHSLDTAKLEACMKAQDDKAIRASMKEGESVGVDATPTMFINGEKLDGAVPADEVRAALDHALRDARVPPPEHKPATADMKASTPAPSK